MSVDHQAVAEPLELHLVKKLESFLPGATLRSGDPRMATATHFQRKGLLSVKPGRDTQGLFAVVRVSDAGYAALDASPRMKRP